MRFPVGADFLDRPSKVLVRISPIDWRLVLRAVRMDRVTMAETMRVVVSNNRLPRVLMPQFQLYRVFQDPRALAEKPASDLRLIEFKVERCLAKPVGAQLTCRDCTYGRITSPGELTAGTAASVLNEGETANPDPEGV